MKGCDGMEPNRVEILEALRKIALSDPNDALILAKEGPGAPGRRLDLWGLSELKIGSNGTVEIKFADRVKAISLLLESIGGGDGGLEALAAAMGEDI